MDNNKMNNDKIAQLLALTLIKSDDSFHINSGGHSPNIDPIMNGMTDEYKRAYRDAKNNLK